jgi:tripartite-type tricarboxylate transporter receptor subunit TctC
MPEIPTISEAGLPGYELGSWYGFFAPAGTPSAIVSQLHREMVRALSDSAVRQQFAGLSAEAVGSTPDEFRAVLKKDLVKWAKVARDANVKAE